MDNETLQQVIRDLNKMIADARSMGDPKGLVRGLLSARSAVRSHVPATLREVDLTH